MDFEFDDEKKSRNILKYVAIGAAAFVIVAGLLAFLILSAISENTRGCEEISNETNIDRCESPFQQVVFVVGDTANTSKPSMSDTGKDVIKYLYDMDNKGKEGLSYISVAEPDNSPQLFSIKKKGSQNIADGAANQIASSVANVDGADYLEAIRNAASYAKDKDDTLIYVIGSGLSDTGLLDFAHDNLLTEYSTGEIKEAVASALEDKHELSGLTIYWDGLGDTVSPQENLNVVLKNKLKNIYLAAFKELGLSENDVVFAKEAKDNIINEDVATTVKTAPVKSESLTIEFSSESSELAFVPNQATFRDQKAAESAIKTLADKNPNSYFIIKPFMSRGRCNLDKDSGLLEMRAEATKNLIVGTGSIPSHDVYMEDGEIGNANECPNGFGDYPVDEAEAVKNRKVMISVIRK